VGPSLDRGRGLNVVDLLVRSEVVERYRRAVLLERLLVHTFDVYTIFTLFLRVRFIVKGLRDHLWRNIMRVSMHQIRQLQLLRFPLFKNYILR
jgi:hypothetical protein